MNPTNLYEYYGGKLPTIDERAKSFESSGLGKATDYKGTAEQNTALLSKLPKGSLIPSTTTPPTTSLDAGAMKDVSQIQPPVGTIPNKSSSIYDATSIFKTTSSDPAVAKDQLTRNIVDKGASAEKQLVEKKAENENLFDKFVGFVTNRPSQATLLAQGKAQYGVDEKVADVEVLTGEVNTLREELAKLEKESSDAVASIEGQGRGIPLGILALQKDKIERQYAARKSAMSAMLGAKSANVAALQGNISLARNLINETIDAKMNDSDQKIQDFKDLYSFNKDIINSLSSDQKDALNAEYKDLSDKADTQRQDLQKVGQLMIDNPKAGVSIDDTFEEAVKKVQRAGGSISARTEARISSGAGTGEEEFKFSPTQINKGISNSGLTRDEFLKLDGETKNIIINNPELASGDKITDLYTYIKDIETGTEDYDLLVADINSSNMPDTTKGYFIGLANAAKAVKDKSAPAPTQSLWSKIKSYFVGN